MTLEESPVSLAQAPTRRLNMIEAINDALDIMLERDSNTVIIGEDVGYFGGVFRATAGLQQRYRLFIENCHVHAAKITQAITGKKPEQIGTIATRRYELPFSEIRAN